MAYKDAVAGEQPYPQPILELPTTIASTGSNFQIRIHPSSFLIFRENGFLLLLFIVQQKFNVQMVFREVRGGSMEERKMCF